MTARRIAIAIAVLLVAGLAAVVVDDDPNSDDVATDASTTTSSGRDTTTSATGPDGSVSSTTTLATTTSAVASSTSGVVAPSPDPAPAPAPPPAPAPGFGDARIRLTQVLGLSAPIAMSTRPGDGNLWFAERGGRIRVLRSGGLATVLDISGETTPSGERGLLGFTFSAGGDRLYLSFTDPNGDSRVDEWTIGGDGVPQPSTRRTLLFVEQPYPNHNGGHVVTGPDGMLYVAFGDGGSGGDPQGNGQNLGTLLGKILRIDPRAAGGAPYAIPGGNPFAGVSGARPEVFIYGVRNPWRFSFDRANGNLWIADVGQSELEEIDLLPAGRQAGANLGWNRFEGSRRFEGDPPANAVPPVFEYGHDEGCSITGGVVYRGARIPALSGVYLFGDYCNGELRGLAMSGTSVTLHRRLGVTVPSLVSFAEDIGGEVYALSLDGPVYRIDPA